MKLLCDPVKRKQLDDILLQDLNAAERYGNMENDAADDNGNPVLLGYLLDIPRIQRFCNALWLQDQRGRLICFDFQREVLERCYGDLLIFETISFEKFERRLF